MSKLKDSVFKQAMSRFPSGVVIVTTVGADGKKCGFTASAFTSLSLDPPLILVCLANSADCYKSFLTNDKFAVNVIGIKQHDLAFKFATKGVEKFNGDEFVTGESGLPIIPDCIFSLECSIKHTYPGGDHQILAGEVQYANVNEGDPSIWYEGSFRGLSDKQ
jgi:flavin reductase ActVB